MPRKAQTPTTTTDQVDFTAPLVPNDPRIPNEPHKHEATWKVWGRGDNATYTAVVLDKLGNPGDVVKMVATSGVVQFADLLQIHKRQEDSKLGVMCEYWTISVHERTSLQKRYARYLTGKHRAEYWATDRAAETQAKIDAKSAAVPTTSTPVTEQASTPAPQVNTGGVVADAFATQVQVFVAAGLDPAAAVIATQAMGLMPSAVVVQTAPETPTPAPAKRGPGRPRKAASTPATSTPAATIPVTSGGKIKACLACGTATTKLFKHAAANVDGICNACMDFDGPTIRTRVLTRAASNGK